MELYKLVTLILILNIGLSMAVTFQDPTKNWADWSTNNIAGGTARFIRNLVTTNLDADNVQTQQNSNQLEYTGGMSIFMLVAIPFGVVENVLIGGLETSIGLVINAWTTANSMISVIAWACLMFIVMMYAWLGFKMYSWVKNRDSQ